MTTWSRDLHGSAPYLLLRARESCFLRVPPRVVAREPSVVLRCSRRCTPSLPPSRPPWGRGLRSSTFSAIRHDCQRPNGGALAAYRSSSACSRSACMNAVRMPVRATDRTRRVRDVVGRRFKTSVSCRRPCRGPARSSLHLVWHRRSRSPYFTACAVASLRIRSSEYSWLLFSSPSVTTTTGTSRGTGLDRASPRGSGRTRSSRCRRIEEPGACRAAPARS